MKIFDGKKLALNREKVLKERIANDFIGKKLKIAAILFIEDSGSRLYTKLKQEAASRIGIDYDIYEFSLKYKQNSEYEHHKIVAKIEELNNDSTITGIIIQKPWRKTWVRVAGQDFIELISQQNDPAKYEREKYNIWWESLTSKISQKKDIDGLHPETIKQIRMGSWQENKKVLPATCRAVLTVLDEAKKLESFSDKKTIIIGKSDLLGKPLYYELLRRNGDLKTEENESNEFQKVELIASKELKKRIISGQKLLDATTIISATGIKHLVTEEMISKGITVIDVGEPLPDVEFKSVSKKTIFITPVPGGIGPMTVVSLLENCTDLAKMQ